MEGRILFISHDTLFVLGKGGDGGQAKGTGFYWELPHSLPLTLMAWSRWPHQLLHPHPLDPGSVDDLSMQSMWSLRASNCQSLSLLLFL